MTKAELVEKVANQINLTKKQTEVVVNTVFSSITDSLAEGKKVELRGFGSFRIRQRNARVGRNPKSGQKVDVPSKKFPFSKLEKNLESWLTKKKRKRHGKIRFLKNRLLAPIKTSLANLNNKTNPLLCCVPTTLPFKRLDICCSND